MKLGMLVEFLEKSLAPPPPPKPEPPKPNPPPPQKHNWEAAIEHERFLQTIAEICKLKLVVVAYGEWDQHTYRGRCETHPSVRITSAISKIDLWRLGNPPEIVRYVADHLKRELRCPACAKEKQEKEIEEAKNLARSGCYSGRPIE